MSLLWIPTNWKKMPFFGAKSTFSVHCQSVFFCLNLLSRNINRRKISPLLYWIIVEINCQYSILSILPKISIRYIIDSYLVSYGFFLSYFIFWSKENQVLCDVVVPYLCWQIYWEVSMANLFAKTKKLHLFSIFSAIFIKISIARYDVIN